MHLHQLFRGDVLKHFTPQIGSHHQPLFTVTVSSMCFEDEMDSFSLKQIHVWGIRLINLQKREGNLLATDAVDGD